MKRTLLLLLFSLSLAAQERDLANYERYLVPVHTLVAIPGAYGAQWRTTLYFRNDGDTPVDAFPLTPSCIDSAICFESVRTAPAFTPRHGGFDIFPSLHPVTMQSAPSGRFLYIERARAEQLSMRLAVGDVSRTPAGSTELPIVPESAFFNTARSILGVPVVPTTRVALRVYTAATQGSITVRVHEMAGHELGSPAHFQPPRLLGERTFSFAYDPAHDTCGFLGCPEGVRYVPATVQLLNLHEVFPELATLRDPRYGLRIEIVPNTPGLRYWPLVTATRDIDGFVSVYTVR
jgi:hypothetical protein